MNKIKLPSMVEYVKNFKNSSKSMGESYWFCDKFANFLSQQPNIGMFVPAVFEDGEWRVLSKPKEYLEWCKWGDFTKYGKSITPKCKEYHEALDNVIFEGWEYNDKELFLDGNLFWVFLNKLKFEEGLTIEQLTPHNLTLAPKFAKELGLI